MDAYPLTEKAESTKSVRTAAWTFVHSELFARFLLFVPFCLLALVAGLNFPLIGDERYHFQTIADFSRALPFPNIGDYQEASGPVPFILWSILGRIIGLEIWKLRLVDVFVACLTVNLFYDLCKRESLPYPLISALTFLFFPYLYVYSVTIYTTNMTELFAVCVLLFYLQNPATIKDLLQGSFWSTLAIGSRQFLLEQPVGLLLYEFSKNSFALKRNLLQVVKENYRRWLVVALPVLLILPLFVIWRGVNPQATQANLHLQLVLPQVNFLPVLIAFYFLPMIVSPKTASLIRHWRISLAALVLLLPMYFAFPLVYHEYSGVTGVIVHGLNIIGERFGSWAETLPKFALWLAGLVIILAEVLDFPYQENKKKLLSFCLTFLVIILFVPVVWERYYVSIIPYVILLLHKSYRNRFLLLSNLAYVVILSVAYSYWRIALEG